MEKVPFTEFDLSGKVAIVTGAGRGMGYHIALALAKYGADLVVCSRTVSELERVGAEIEKLGRRVLIQQMDVTKILAELNAEREQIEEAILSLERLAQGRGRRRGRPPAWMSEMTVKRRGRPPGSKNKVAANDIAPKGAAVA
jgi:NAD(P)-dependent dehydrogenase (short-subunit alcohol dehydrogenase family)